MSDDGRDAAARDEILRLYKMLDDTDAAERLQHMLPVLARSRAAKSAKPQPRRHIDRRLLFPWLLRQNPGAWEALAAVVRRIKADMRRHFLDLTKGTDAQRDTARVCYVSGKRWWKKVRDGLSPLSAAIQIAPNYLVVAEDIRQRGLPPVQEYQPFTMLHSWVVQLDRAARVVSGPILKGNFPVRGSNGLSSRP